MKLGIIMDPIQGITIKKDSSFAMLLAAQAIGWEIYYMEMGDLYIKGSVPGARMRTLKVTENNKMWFEFSDETIMDLQNLDIILMRKDPPVDMEYIHVTQMLELAQQTGVLVVNDPSALRTNNEKLFICRFPEYIAPTLVSRNVKQINNFIKEHHDIILKPINQMGGESIFYVNQSDINCNVIIETLTKHETNYIVAQRFLPEIKNGDKRILLINGEPVPHALARIPKNGDIRGNLAAGGKGEGVELTERDRQICQAISPVLRDQGLLFVGIDVIGDYLTEINITSPTCIRELNAIFNLDIAGELMKEIEKKRREG